MTKEKKGKRHPAKSYIQTGIRWFWGAVAAGLITATLLFVAAGLFGNIPPFEELENPKSNLATQIFADDKDKSGKPVVLGTFHIENRSYVAYDELSPDLVSALIATEDIRFYSHSGIDFYSLGRVAVKTILGGDRRSGGGSTISQQLALNLFSERATSRIKRALWQKPAEWITAVKLERNYTKNEIIAMYFNTVFYGSNAYGIRAAASTYFGKHPSQLTTEEAAMLVGLVNAPTMYSPVRNYDRAVARRNHVLSQMAKYSFIAQSACDSLKELPITLTYQMQDHLAGQAPYFRDMLRRIMNMAEPNPDYYRNNPKAYSHDSTAWASDPFYGWLNKNLKPDGSRYDLDRDGLKIYTTIDSRMQRYAEEAIVEHLKNDLQPAFDTELKYRKNFPFSNARDPKLNRQSIRQAITASERYRIMKRNNESERAIDAAFKQPVRMTVFSWQRGHVDTLMSPLDSILYYKAVLRAAVMAIEPHTGFVRAYVGGPNYFYFKYDNVRQSRRQVGSTIKPFLYTLAMQEGHSPCERVLNVSQTFIVGDTTWTPRTTDREEWIGKMVTLKWGLTNSSNNISAYLMKQFGPDALIKILEKMGVQNDLPPVPSLCLGSCEISLYDMTGAYNTFPSQGMSIDPFFVTSIKDKDDNTLTTFISHKHEAISQAAAYRTVSLMQGVVNEGTARRLRTRYIPEGQVAGKTGTTNDQSDGWFIGYMPRLTAGVWVGCESPDVHFESLALGGGANMAMPVWGLFMKKVLADPRLNVTTTDLFDVPPGVPEAYSCTGGDDDGELYAPGDDGFF
ncbi:MAG: transglycosylase domain-containing protein [Prevotellaceae bacterium]|jgi:penicillin-binding protein 1A|nr:transglycosylase domain-containing protein [Prevotellaceae bacterium]